MDYGRANAAQNYIETANPPEKQRQITGELDQAAHNIGEALSLLSALAGRLRVSPPRSVSDNPGTIEADTLSSLATRLNNRSNSIVEGLQEISQLI